MEESICKMNDKCFDGGKTLIYSCSMGRRPSSFAFTHDKGQIDQCFFEHKGV